MEYRIKRGEQEFGPYTLSELQQYVQSGNVATSDMAQSEGSDEWIPVSAVLGDIPVAASVSVVDAPSYATDPKYDNLPPNLHWGWVLLIDIFTRQFFNMIWAMIQANWARKITGKNNAIVLISMYPAGIICGIVAVAIGKATGGDEILSILGGILILAGSICLILGNYAIRDAIDEYYEKAENISSSLSGVMTFFFGTLYLQYHFNQLARLKKERVAVLA